MFKHKDDYEKLCLLLGYQFRNKRLLAQALTTKSACHNKMQQSSIGHQEQMEFLGDSLLRLVVDQILMEEFPHAMPNELSKLRDNLVKNANLSKAANQLGLANYIIMDQNQTRQCKNTSTSKVLADTMEALICAIYTDSNNNLKLVKEFILTNSMIAKVLNDYRNELCIQYLPFVKAIETADLITISNLLEENYNPNLVLRNSYQHIVDIEDDYFTALSLAVSCLKQLAQAEKNTESMLSVIDLLIKKGADPNLRIKNQPSMAHDLIPGLTYEGERTDTYFYRFRNISNINSQLNNDFDQIIEKYEIPSWHSLTDKVFTLFCKAGIDFTLQDSSDNTLLTLAVIYNQSYKIDLFLKSGAEVDFLCHQDETALHIAAEMGHSEIVKKLIKSNASINIHNKRDKTPFDMAKTLEIKYQLLKAELAKLKESNNVKNSLPDNFNRLNEQAIQLYQEGIKSKSAECLSQSISSFQTILKHLQAVNFTTATQFVSAYYNLGSAYFESRNYPKAKIHLERAYILCLYEIGANEERTQKIKQRLDLCNAKFNEKTDNFFLTQNPHTVFSKNFSSSSTENINELDNKLFQMVKLAQATGFEVLLTKGANPDACDEQGQNILSYSILQYANACLMYRSTADLLDYPELSPGYHMKKGLQNIIDLLLKWKVDVNQRDSQGKTALHWAAITGDFGIVNLLLKAQADPTISDSKGNYPSNLATDEYTKTILLKALQIANTKEKTSENEYKENIYKSFTL
ncbi:MAG: Ribonuclease 3 [Legionellaceae bacterium]